MGSIAAWFGLIAGIAAAAQVVATVSRRIARVRAMHQARQRQVAEASRDVRERARATLALRREEKAMQRELRDLGGHIDTGEQTIQKKRGNEALIHVLDERRAAGDHPFTVQVRHPRFSDVARNPPPEVTTSWAAGRTYLIWAPTDKSAGAKAAVRFPAERGYTVGPAESWQGNPDDI